jgi:hypothetical protein
MELPQLRRDNQDEFAEAAESSWCVSPKSRPRKKWCDSSCASDCPEYPGKDNERIGIRQASSGSDGF